ncbi:hypothetical protein M422DRAFT_38933 [Sphaerobolus stellatus SS14]|uniref:Unplaced genomic scaffold SPHSTscaffold_364, whole genome shotgun sequence n=1 Tax=Sphaerobolus stellatus (strain SS14) TaxID=990650 RepID=A0A0C9T7N1_SPHS4|nr:hypothetical protein M422DRAFT_38933 [Sphaerobolus stellatus SS14]
MLSSLLSPRPTRQGESIFSISVPYSVPYMHPYYHSYPPISFKHSNPESLHSMKSKGRFDPTKDDRSWGASWYGRLCCCGIRGQWNYAIRGNGDIRVL